MIRFPHRVAGLSFALAITLVLGACASTGGSPTLFVLDDSQTPTTNAHTSGAPTLLIATVSVAPYLDQGGIVYQSAPHRIVIADNNRWAAPLPGALTDNLETRLGNRLQGVDLIRSTTRHRRNYTLQTRVDEFGGHFDGQSHIAGQWRLMSPDGDTLLTRSFEQRIPLDQDGYPALVASLSKGWHKVADNMAPVLQTTVTAQDH